MQHFWHIRLYYFKKGKNATETQKKIAAVFGEGAVTNEAHQKWFVKSCAGEFLLYDAQQSRRPIEAHSNQIEMLNENKQCYYYMVDSRHTQNIQINKVIGDTWTKPGGEDGSKGGR